MLAVTDDTNILVIGVDAAANMASTPDSRCGDHTSSSMLQKRVKSPEDSPGDMAGCAFF
jgi:hypothetical protein